VAKRRKQRNWTEIVVWVISVLVVLSMVIGFVVSVLEPEPPASPPASFISSPPPNSTGPGSGNGVDVGTVAPAPNPTPGATTR
jgi:hypothetical protein